MTGPEREEEFEQYLKHRTILPHRLAESERFEPPPDVHRVILARAREAIRASAPAPVYRSARWALPFGLAATLIITFAVILHLRQPVPTTAALTPSNPMVVDTSTAAPAAEFAIEARESRARNSAPPAYAHAKDERKAAPYRTVQPTVARPETQALRATAAKRIPAEQWLAKIEHLRDAGKDKEADREQAAFEKAYPNHQRSRLKDSTR